MLILCCGDRHWRDFNKVYDTLKEYQSGHVIHGGCRGADLIAATAARQLHFSVTEFKADWNLHGYAAGPIRNRVMLDRKPDLVIAFHSDLANSKGTKDTVNEAKRRGIPVRIVT